MPLAPDIVDRLRAGTPGCGEVLHLDHAGMSLSPQVVLDAVVGHLRLEAHIGGYRAAEQVGERVLAARAAAARLVGGHPDEVAFMESATRGWNAALHAFDWTMGDRVVVGANEYGSNMVSMLQLARRLGVVVDVAPLGEDGRVDVDALEALVTSRTRLVALTHVATSSGTVQPAAEVGVVAARHGLPFLLDACQSAGQLPLDVDELGCTMLAFTGRKYLRGPRGTGALWVRRDWCTRLDPVPMDALGAAWSGPDDVTRRDDARRFELFERSVAGVLGLGAALELLHGLGIEDVSEQIALQASGLRSRLSALPRVRLLDRGAPLCGIVGFQVEGLPAAEAKRRLRERNVNVSVSEVDMTRLDLQPRGIDALVRASVHVTTTDAELDRFTGLIKEL